MFDEVSATFFDIDPAVYSIVNTETGKRYIGQSIRPAVRIANHFQKLKQGKHASVTMQHDWNDLGPVAFTASIVTTTDNPDELLDLEDEEIMRCVDEGVGLYNYRGRSWVNEEEAAARARARAEREREKRILQRKREAGNETRHPTGGNSGNEGAVSEDGNVQRGGGVSRVSSRTSMEGGERGLRIEEAGLRAGEQGADRKAGTEGSETQGVDADGRRGKGNRDDHEALSISFGEYRGWEAITKWDRRQLEAPECLFESAEDLAYIILSYSPPDVVDRVVEILEWDYPVFITGDPYQAEKIRKAADAHPEGRTRWLIERAGLD